MKKTRGAQGKENGEYECDISSSDNEHDLTGEIPVSISDSISKKFELAKCKDVPEVKRNLKLTTGHIEALLNNRQSSPQSGLQA